MEALLTLAFLLAGSIIYALYKQSQKSKSEHQQLRQSIPKSPSVLAKPLQQRPRRANLEPFKITLLARSSSGGHYPVTFTCRDNRLWLKCGCTAGKFSWFCKHKFHLLNGEADWLYDQNHHPELAKIQAILPDTGFPALLEHYKNANATAELKDAKKQLKLAMRHGA